MAWSYDAVPNDSRVRVTRAETVRVPDGTRSPTLYTRREYNLAGELVKLVEGDSNNRPNDTLPADGVVTEYAWYGSGLLKSTTVNGNYTTGFKYDAAGNRTEVTNPNFSTVTLRHTAAGELWRREESGRTTTWTYDGLGRPTRRQDPDGVSEWEWDPANGRGSLSKRCREDTAGATTCRAMTAPDFRETRTYGSDARLDRVATTIRAGGLVRNYTHSYTHDTHGRLKTVTHPSGLTVERRYNARGYLRRLRNRAGGANLITYGSVNARGQATEESYGNGTKTVRTFDPNSGHPTDIDTTLGTATEIQDDTYRWRSDGLMPRDRPSRRRPTIRTGGAGLTMEPGSRAPRSWRVPPATGPWTERGGSPATSN